MGYIPTAPAFFENKTVYQNLQYLLKVRKIKKSDMEDKINRLLIDYNLEKLRERKVKNLKLVDKYVLSMQDCLLRN
jgi:ABC-type multidrug transport system ATPase subunit